MFRLFVCAALLLPLITACEKDQLSSFETGVYKGTFRRTGVGYSGAEIASVTLIFDGNNFSGTSSEPYYPVIGAGKFSVLNDNIIFDNQSVFTANFDWTLILDDTFSRNSSGDSLILIKGHGDFVFYHDVYTLKRQ